MKSGEVMVLSGCIPGHSPGSLRNQSAEDKVVKQMHLLGQILATEVNGRKLFDFPFAVSVGSGFNQEETELCSSGLKLKKKPTRIVLYRCTLLKTVRIL